MAGSTAEGLAVSSVPLSPARGSAASPPSLRWTHSGEARSDGNLLALASGGGEGGAEGVDGEGGSSLASLLRLLLTETGYDAMLTAEGEESSRLRNLGELVNLASERTVGEIDEFLDQIALVSDVDALDGQGGATPKRKDAVQLSTIHGAKGLEFDVTFVTGVEEGLLPHYYCTESLEEVEQERRLLYVAMTRARERLVLTHGEVRSRWGTVAPVLRSRFLDDLPTAALEVEAPPPAQSRRGGGRGRSFGNSRGYTHSRREQRSWDSSS